MKSEFLLHPIPRGIGAFMAALLLSSFALGCGDDAPSAPLLPAEEPDPPKFDYPLDNVLRLNHIQTKGTHNSYHIQPDDALLAWSYTHATLDVQLDAQGVRKVELDTHYNSELGIFEVYHIGILDEETTCRRFTDCLSTMKQWSNAHPAHHTLFVQIEPKDSFDPLTADAYWKEFEAEILSVWPRKRIVTPDDVKGDAASLREAVTTVGFPTLGEGRAKILFFMNKGGSFRDDYTRGGANLDGRLMFVESEVGKAAPYDAVYILNDPKTQAQAIADIVSAGFIVRTRADASPEAVFNGDTTEREAALATAAQLLSTDFPAKVAGVDYVVEIPGGEPSRCNPLSAPPECTAKAIEDPAFLASPAP